MNKNEYEKLLKDIVDNMVWMVQELESSNKKSHVNMVIHELQWNIKHVREAWKKLRDTPDG